MYVVDYEICQPCCKYNWWISFVVEAYETKRKKIQLALGRDEIFICQNILTWHWRMSVFEISVCNMFYSWVGLCTDVYSEYICGVDFRLDNGKTLGGQTA